MTGTAQRTFCKLAGSEFDFTVKRILEAFDNDNIPALEAEVRTQTRYAESARGMGNIHAFLAEFASAALEAADVMWSMFVPCDDCGNPIPWSGGESEFEADGKRVPSAVCGECGDSRDFKHGTGRYYDAFA